MYTSEPTSPDNVVALHGSLDLVAADRLSTMDVDVLGSRCVELQTARQKLDGLIAVTVAEAERAGVAANAGQRTMAQYLASRTHACPDAVRADLRNGVWVGQYAVLEEAMLAGLLSRQHVDLIRRIDNIRVFAALQRDQQLFIGFAHDLEWKSFRAAVAYWLLVNDPDGTSPKEHEQKNTCTITRYAGGRIKLVAFLDPLSGAIVEKHIGLERNQLFEQDQENNVARTNSQRSADALTNIVTRGAGRIENSSVPLISVVMSLKVLLHALAQLDKHPADQDFTSVVDPNDPDGRCELIDGTPLHPKSALILLMTARIRRQVLTAQSLSLNASYESRLFPESLKNIRLVETRGQCETAGCDAPIEWLQGDHNKPYSKTARTTLSDLRMLCRPDNKHKSNGPPLATRHNAPPRPDTNPPAGTTNQPNIYGNS